MARSSGFSITRHIRNFLHLLNVDYPEGVSEAQAIFEIRSICKMYQPLPAIQNDLTEIALLEQANQDSEEEAA